MTKKVDPVAALLEQMNATGLPVQRGGFDIEAVPSGIAGFDFSTGVGGFPRGRVSLVQGEEGSGKTLLVLVTIANTQRKGGRCAFIDLEHALTPSFAQLMGVDMDSLVISRPTTLNEAYDVARTLISSGLFDVVGFDSAVALATEDELNSSAKDSGKRAGQAQVHSQELRKVASLVARHNPAFIMINQLRENPNPPSWHRGGKILYSPGGRALKHASSLTVDVSMKQPYKRGTQRVGHRTKTYIRKNKVGVPYRAAEFDLMYETGVDVMQETITAAIRTGVIEKRSSFFYFTYVDEHGEEIDGRWNGRAKLDEAVKEDQSLYSSLVRAMSDTPVLEHTTEAGSWDEIDDEDEEE